MYFLREIDGFMIVALVNRYIVAWILGTKLWKCKIIMAMQRWIIPPKKFCIPVTLEHKHLEFGIQKKTGIIKDCSIERSRNKEPHYPINDLRNNEMYSKYKTFSELDRIIFGEILVGYKHYLMHQEIASALAKCNIIID